MQSFRIAIWSISCTVHTRGNNIGVLFCYLGFIFLLLFMFLGWDRVKFGKRTVENGKKIVFSSIISLQTSLSVWWLNHPKHNWYICCLWFFFFVTLSLNKAMSIASSNWILSFIFTSIGVPIFFIFIVCIFCCFCLCLETGNHNVFTFV